MCFSSSTTRILEVIDPPTGLIVQTNVRRRFYMCQRNVKGGPPHLWGDGGEAAGGAVSFWSPRPVPTSLVRAQDQLDRVPDEPETVTDLLLEVAPVGEVKEACVVDEHDDGGRFAGGLRPVTELEPPALEAGWWMVEERLPQDAVQLVGRHLDPALTDHFERGRQQCPDAFPRLGRDRGDGRVRRELELPGQGRAPVGGLSLRRLDQV